MTKVKIPDVWEIVKIGDVCSSIVPGRDKPKVFDGHIPWITITDIDGREIYDSKLSLAVSEEELKTCNGKIIPTNSIIMNCVGEFGIVAINKKPIVINQQLHAFIPSKKVIIEYILYALKSSTKIMERYATKTSVAYLNKDNCEKIPIALPPIDLQKKIAEILGTIDRTLELTEKLITAKRKLKQALMQKLLTGKLRFPEFEGQKWVKSSLGLICDIQIGGTPSRQKIEYWSQSQNIGFPWVSIRDMQKRFLIDTNEKITEQGIKNSNVKKVPKGTTMMSFKLTIGKVAQAGCDLYTNEAIASFFPLKNQVIQDFLYEGLPFWVLRASTDTAIKGATLNKQKLSILPVTLPNVMEQKKICSFSNLLGKEIEDLENKLNLLKQQKKGLMQQLLTGKIRVKIDN